MLLCDEEEALIVGSKARETVRLPKSKGFVYVYRLAFKRPVAVGSVVRVRLPVFFSGACASRPVSHVSSVIAR